MATTILSPFIAKNLQKIVSPLLEHGFFSEETAGLFVLIFVSATQ